ncbi:MAG: hypothetical protein ACTH9F_09855 [Brachybacterium tyrofermentans]
MRSAREFAASRTWDAAAETLSALYTSVLDSSAITTSAVDSDPAAGGTA